MAATRSPRLAALRMQSSPSDSLAPALPDPAIAAFMTIMDRLEAVVDGETGALKLNLPARVGETGQRKRQGMLELGRAMRLLAKDGPDPRVQERLRGFAAKLEDNRRVLDTHLRAVRDVADIIARTMREMESDGTYSRLAGHP